MKVTALNAILAGGLLGFSALSNAADFSGVPSGTYSVDPTHAYVTFSYNHLGLSNPILSFEEFTIDLNLDNEDPTKSTVNVTIDVASVVTGSEIWSEHIAGEKFFDTANNPEITFTSTSIEAARDGNYTVSGDLMIKGEKKPVSLDVTINAAMPHPFNGNPTIGLQAVSTLLRSDFNMGANAPAVSDEIALNITAELNQPK